MKFYRIKISNQPDGKLIHNFPPPKIYTLGFFPIYGYFPKGSFTLSWKMP